MLSNKNVILQLDLDFTAIRLHLLETQELLKTKMFASLVFLPEFF